jgi:3-oxoacyl-[acyl-carrier protein] reductase
MDLEGRVALVTAAAGAGIGRASAHALAKAGADVVVTDKHERRTTETAAAIAKETGRKVIGIPLDVTDEAQVNEVIRQANAEMGHIDILVNNSGINELVPVWEMPTETWNKVILLCLTAHFWTIRAVLPGMMERRRGAIINISSGAAWEGSNEGEVHYCAAKAGVTALTRATAAEVAPYGIRVNCIAPGLVYNEFLSRIYPQEFFDRVAAETPIGRVGAPEDIANAVVYLASDKSSYMVGETLSLSGGHYFHA